VIKKWRGKYNALLECSDSAFDKWVDFVESEEHEEALRYYETDNYETVRCGISMNGREEAFKGITFRFVGPFEDLS